VRGSSYYSVTLMPSVAKRKRPGVPIPSSFTPLDASARLASLRSVLSSRSLGGYVVPSADAHSSEYVSAVDARRAWLTGFTGSAGLALVTHSAALLWTDGRYFVQAAEQLGGGPWTLMKMHEPGVPSLEEYVAKEQRCLRGPIGIDPALATLSATKAWADKGCNPCALIESNLVDEVWTHQPERPAAAVVARTLADSGESVSCKLGRVGSALGMSGCDGIVLNALDQICWLFNIRGADIECNPVCFAYAVVTRTGGADGGDAGGGGADGKSVRATLYLRWLDGSGTESEAAEAKKKKALDEHFRSEGCATFNDDTVDADSSTPTGVSVVLRRYADFNAEEAWRALTLHHASPAVMLERGIRASHMSHPISSLHLSHAFFPHVPPPPPSIYPPVSKSGVSSTFCLQKWRLLHLLSLKVASPPPFVSKSGVSSTFCLKKWRLLHLLSQKVASPPPFVSKSGVSSTFCLQKWRLLHLLSQKVASPPPFVSQSGVSSTFCL